MQIYSYKRIYYIDTRYLNVSWIYFYSVGVFRRKTRKKLQHSELNHPEFIRKIPFSAVRCFYKHLKLKVISIVSSLYKEILLQEYSKNNLFKVLIDTQTTDNFNLKNLKRL